MRIRIDRLSLVGAGRKVEFRPGLNVIYGPISTGKTSVLRLCRIVMGSAVTALPRELLLVPAVGAKVSFADKPFEIVRPLSESRTAMVEVAGDGTAQRFPALQGASGQTTYGQWLLEQLGLPRVEVPSAPTRPDSEPTPVSVNDYFAYCDLPKEEIRSDIFGHRHPFKDIKRKYVFEIIYGQYDVQVAKLQDDLRALRAQIRGYDQDRAAFDRLLEATAWENRAALQRELSAAEEVLDKAAAQVKQVAAAAPRDSKALGLRRRLRELDEEIGSTETRIERERADAERFLQLAAQLETQVGRLTRALIANETLLDIEFIVCPRCGAGVSRTRGSEQICYLCQQIPATQYGRSDLIAEQDRVAAQLEETRQLASSRRKRVGILQGQAEKARAERSAFGRELDETMQSFVSDSAAHLQEAAARRAAASERKQRLLDYLKLFERRDQVNVSVSELREREAELLARLEEAKARREDVEQRIVDLEQRFTNLLRQLSLPAFLGRPEGRIDRRTYLPSVNGRSFETLQSEGLAVEVNIAHALAHQLNALAHGLGLPSILLIDGISGAFGEKGYDPVRAAAVYEQLLKACEEAKGALQVVVADTRVPDLAKASIVLELSERERLVPESYLAAVSGLE